GAAERVNADVTGDRHVFFAERVGVREGAAAIPVLGGALRVHDLGQTLWALGGQPVQNAVGSLGERIGTVAVGEREIIGRVKVLLMLSVVPGRLGEAMVEEAEPTARDVRDDAVEDRAIRFIGVEAKIEEVAKETAALRDAERMGALSGWLAFREQRILLRFVVAQERDQVAGRGVAETLHDRALGLADQFIDVARPKAAPEPQPNLPKCARHAVLDLRDGLAL